MTWTYDALSGSDKDMVRLYTGDTNSSKQLLQDEDIANIIANPLFADWNQFVWAAVACETIAGALARRTDATVGPMKTLRAQEYDHYKELADKYWLLGTGLPGGAGFAGGFLSAVPTSGSNGLAAAFGRTNWDTLGPNYDPKHGV